MKFHNFMSNLLLCYFQPLFSKPKTCELAPKLNMEINAAMGDSEKLSKSDVKVVMERLGMRYEIERNDGADELLGEMFGDEEPGLEEIKEAFDVFDDNKDGFIDATELQRVLICLGVRGKMVTVEECKRMIRVADEDGDGRVDFNEFLKFMQTCFC
ncbi:hypothetical protein E1A91_A04G186600v1 [Gossypium mustelinum]|uniref:EF-hand domain-containing protein n=3 Tax=Gossypium TaxID=3633 RepID=A0A2P5WKC5_GOSBA|nr:hypothetical protein ES319_A04G175500v1 [Gossypium barbadense]PPR91546.1 hypothetical protein GOBAR_AA29146 [Gossypium barbadense]TYH23251.1 hypothetical protein ES288_A04G194500v1 [Gossypium darwinii]TYJ41110.1 hypothetical protein E1A91_A04G186600v1 [Gossypium mustelinum]